MKQLSFLARLWNLTWFRRVLLVVLILFVYWVGAGFPNPFARYVGSDFVKSEYGGYGGYGEESLLAMESDFSYEDSMAERSFAPVTASILPPPIPEEGSGDLTKYGEVGPRIIKTGAVSMDVKNTEETLVAVSDLATNYGGFVQSSNTWLNYNDTLSGSVTLRVKSEHFEAAMEAIKQLATVLRSESVSGQDVTEEFIDLTARLETLRAEEAQYLEVLKQAKTVEDILKVNDYLAGVRSDIESAEGRLQYLENRTSFSTITVDVTEEASVVAPTRDWKPIVVIKQAINQLVVAGQGFVNLLIWVVIFGVPVLAVIGVGWWVVRR